MSIISPCINIPRNNFFKLFLSLMLEYYNKNLSFLRRTFSLHCNYVAATCCNLLHFVKATHICYKHCLWLFLVLFFSHFWQFKICCWSSLWNSVCRASVFHSHFYWQFAGELFCKLLLISVVYVEKCFIVCSKSY